MNTMTVQDSRPVHEILDWSRATVVPALRAAVDQLPESLRLGASYHLGWREPDGSPAAGSPGKLIRPALVLLSARAVGAAGAGTLHAAVAIELVHNFSLVHDDVMDRDETRRHRPTVWALFGIPEAILVGDALLGLAFQEIALTAAGAHGQQAMRWLADYVIALCDGQLADVRFEKRSTIGMGECLPMIAGKTSTLLAGACALGALTGGADAPTIDAMRGFGHHLGTAFQLVDDLLGIWGDPAVTGKPAGADLVRRKKSTPVVAALNSGTAAGDELAAIYRGADPIDVEHASGLVELAGGRRWAEEYAEAELVAARACLERAECEPTAAAELSAVADLLTHRNH